MSVYIDEYGWEIDTDKIKNWEIIEFPDSKLCSCDNCGYEGYDFAETEERIIDDDGTRQIFCPKCKSPHYYIISKNPR